MAIALTGSFGDYLTGFIGQEQVSKKTHGELALNPSASFANAWVDMPAKPRRGTSKLYP